MFNINNSVVGWNLNNNFIFKDSAGGDIGISISVPVAFGWIPLLTNEFTRIKNKISPCIANKITHGIGYIVFKCGLSNVTPKLVKVNSFTTSGLKP